MPSPAYRYAIHPLPGSTGRRSHPRQAKPGITGRLRVAPVVTDHNPNFAILYRMLHYEKPRIAFLKTFFLAEKQVRFSVHLRFTAGQGDKCRIVSIAPAFFGKAGNHHGFVTFGQLLKKGNDFARNGIRLQRRALPLLIKTNSRLYKARAIRSHPFQCLSANRRSFCRLYA